MKQIVTVNIKTFKVGDRVQFNKSINDRGMNMFLNTEYGVITKMNKVTALVKTETAAWKIELDELNHYKDPFNWYIEQ